MSLQPMPILDRMLKLRSQCGVPEDDIEAAWGAVKVRADVPADMYWQSSTEVWRIDHDYPPMRLPFPTMWIEWSQPQAWKSGRRDIQIGSSMIVGPQLGALLVEVEIPDDRVMHYTAPGVQPLKVVIPRSAHSAFQLIPYGMREGRLSSFPFSVLVPLNKEGMQFRQPMYCGNWAPNEEESAKLTIDFLQSRFSVALLAIGLMNCKNVTTTEFESTVRIGRKGHRRSPGVVYRTINVPGYPSGTGGGSGQATDVMPLHRVRGHFKTFTPEAPLLGQHVGTYWWGWQVRGNKKNGATVTDYRVTA